jgi:hypothetical protein
MTLYGGNLGRRSLIQWIEQVLDACKRAIQIRLDIITDTPLGGTKRVKSGMLGYTFET